MEEAECEPIVALPILPLVRTLPASARPILGAARRTLSRFAARIPAPERPQTRSFEGECRARKTQAAASSFLGRLLLALERPVLAARAIDAGFDPMNGRMVEALARALAEAGPERLVHAAPVGLRRRHKGDTQALQTLYRIAQSTNVGSRQVRDRLAWALLSDGEVGLCIALVQPCKSEHSLVLARAAEVRARQLGEYGTAQASEAVALLSESVASGHGTVQTLDRLVTTLCSLRRFVEADHVAGMLPGNHPSRTAANWSRLVDEGAHSQAHDFKSGVAQGVTQTRVSRSAAASAHIERFQAEMYVANLDAAQERLDDNWIFASTKDERQLREKLSADLALARGDISPIQRYRREYEDASANARTTFDAMVRGHHVLLVGPAPSCQPTETEVTNADVVVTTRQRPHSLPARQASITYIADETLHRSGNESTFELDLFPHHLIVARPSMLNYGVPTWLRHDQVRVMPFEDSTSFRSTHFGIPRALYDLLAAGPARITVTGVDFYVGDTSHVLEYQETAETEQLSNFSHDHAEAHAFVRRLFRMGLLDAGATTGEILGWTTKAYLSRLDA